MYVRVMDCDDMEKEIKRLFRWIFLRVYEVYVFVL